MLRASIVTLATTLFLATALAGDEPKQLNDARRTYQSLKQRTEADRVRYITQLVRLRESFTRADYKIMEAIDAEVIQHPMPSTADSRELVKRLLGKWTSPRHQYLYRSDGTWTMLPEFVDGVKSTAGTWRIEGNKFVQDFKNLPGSGEEIILLTATDFVWSTRRAPYYMRKGDVFPWRD